MHQRGFIERNFQGNSPRRTLIRGVVWGGGGGEFTEGGFSWYQFSEWTSAFKHVKKMTAVIKHTVFDK